MAVSGRVPEVCQPVKGCEGRQATAHAPVCTGVRLYAGKTVARGRWPSVDNKRAGALERVEGVGAREKK